MFENKDRSNTRGFKYTDSSDDEVEFWRYSDDSVWVRTNGDGPAIEVSRKDIDQLIEELTRLSKAPCPNCKGTGIAV
jgi:hypothetical protein